MVRHVAIAGLTAAMLLGLAAHAQEVVPELAGGPGSHPATTKQDLTTKQATRQAARQAQAAADKLKADKARLDQQASAQTAEQARLAKQAADLKTQQAKLDARAAALAAEEKHLVQLRAEQATDHAAKLAEITRQKKAVDQQAAALHVELAANPTPTPQAPPSQPAQVQLQSKMADAKPRSANRLESHAPDINAGAPIDITKPEPIQPPVERADIAEKPDPAERRAAPDRAPDRPLFADRDSSDTTPEAPRALAAHLDLDAARQSCARAGEDAAMARRYYSARYDDAVRVYQDRGWKLRGHMRLEGRRGDLLIDTVCDVDANGEAQHFAFVRGSAEAD